MLEDRNIAQVSINMVNPGNTIVSCCRETVRSAQRYGVRIIGTELIGLALKLSALIDSAEYYLQLEDFDYSKQVLKITVGLERDL